ncbi:PAS domain-containing protein [Streptomyces seoulensis]|uniref:PAS domain-containing protein n=1 Tax=Streptomyces seoulensis TaxID=73044 RepID=A0A4P6TXJ5_STRSO|nr:PAS domain-containing protein [Streptomyces seoulensis]QBJ91314.1 PAS domain-containing protein [Streptomyces seoulensis]
MSSRPSRGAARLAAILDALPDALLLVNANGTVVNANTIALEAFEAPGTALVGRGLLDLLPQFDSKLIPGSMRRPDHMDPAGRTKPTRMVARRTDGTEFPVEVTSANLENPQQAYDGSAYTGDELLMLVVRDLSGTVDTEAELARSQRQTEMILRAASEGVVGTDTDGRIVLVNPAAAQILGYRAGELGGRELHTLVLHSRADGSPFPYDESPLADTLRSGRKHRVRGQVLWSKAGDEVSVDLTTAPVRDGDQLVGAVMTFTDRRPYQSLADEKEALEQAHAKELERIAEEHAADLTALRQKHATEVEELTERGAAELTELREKLQEELAAGEERYAALGEREKDRYDALAGRHEQLLTLLASSLRGPLDELRRELAALAADDAGQLWPEANQVLHHLSAGYARITALIDNVLGFQRLDSGTDDIARTKVMLDAVVAAGVDGAVELIGPGRVQFAVHAPPIEAEVDPQRLATALAHLVADVAGVDATGNAPVSSAGYLDNTVVVAAAQRGEVARIEVRGPYAGGDPVHEPIVRGIVRAHGGVLQTHEVPGMSGRAYVLEVPLGGGAGTVAAPVPDPRAAVSSGAEVALVGDAGEQGGRRRARRSSTDAFLQSEVAGAEAPGAAAPTGRRRRRGAPAAEELAPAAIESAEPASSGTGRRRGRPAEVGDGVAAEGAVMTAAEHAAGTAASNTGLGGAVPPQGVPVPAGQRAPQGAGEQAALPPALPAPSAEGVENTDGTDGAEDASEDAQPTGRRRRALAAAAERAAAQDTGARTVFALPPAEADRAPEPETPGVRVGPLAEAQVPGAGTAAGAGVAPGLAVNAGPVPVRGLGQGVGPVPAQGAAPAQMPGVAPGPVPAQAPAPMPGVAPTPVPAQAPAPAPVAPLAAQAQPPVPPQPPAEVEPGDGGRHDAVPVDQSEDHTPPQPHPTTAPTGRRRRAVAQPAQQQEAAIPAQAAAPPAQPLPVPAQATAPEAAVPAQPLPAEAAAPAPAPAAPGPVPQPWPDDEDDDTAGAGLPRAALPPQFTPQARAAQPLPAEAPDATQGRAISVRTLGQGVPFVRQAAQVQQPTATPPPHATNGSGRRRKLGTPPPRPEAQPEAGARPHPEAAPAAAQPRRAPGTEGVGRSYAIGAPDANAAEGPEPLDGPGGAVEVADTPRPQPMDDELPPEPLDNPRRLLVWPAPDVTTSEALSTRGYRPVVVHSREEVDAQIAAFPAALFVDPLTGPITRTALQSLRQAAVAAEVPVLVTAGLGQASREAAYGADPAVLLKALAPRDSEQHPPRVLLVEEHAEIALALTATLERRGMQVARAASDADAVTLAGQFRPNLVVMDLMQAKQRQAGIVDWLRANGQLDRTPLVVYTAAVEQADLPKLASGETVLFLAERSTSDEVQGRIVDLLARIGTN